MRIRSMIALAVLGALAVVALAIPAMAHDDDDADHDRAAAGMIGRAWAPVANSPSNCWRAESRRRSPRFTRAKTRARRSSGPCVGD